MIASLPLVKVIERLCGRSGRYDPATGILTVTWGKSEYRFHRIREITEETP